MPKTPDAARERVQRDELLACECSPADFHRMRRLMEEGGEASAILEVLDRALLGKRTVESSLEATHLAQMALASHLNAQERAHLAELESQVMARHVGPSALKSAIYRLARHYRVPSLLKSSWFDELFDRVETRRLTDQDSSL